jgi:hypothetical protein
MKMKETGFCVIKSGLRLNNGFFTEVRFIGSTDGVVDWITG